MHARFDINVEVTLDDEDVFLVVVVNGIFCSRLLVRGFLKGALEATIES